METDGALDIFPQIQTLVSDKLQVVSYKWLSRNFSLSSNYAKRLLKEFAEKYQNELEIIYTLSGWLKSEPKTYCIKLASSLKLAEVKKEFQDSCSVQVYSVQACIPNDLAVLWNAEFIQAEELFNQPLAEKNCLRDNRFCGVSNSFVKRNVDGKNAHGTPQQPRVDVVASKSNSIVKDHPVHPPMQGLADQSGARPGEQSSTIIKSEKIDKIEPVTVERASRPPFVKETVTTGNTFKRKGQNEKAASGNSGSLASLWGRASAKPKSLTTASGTANSAPGVTNPITAEAQICAQEAAEAVSSEEDDHYINCKRDSNGLSSRKRRVVLDFSDDDDDDDEENVVSLASPDPPQEKNTKESQSNSESSVLERRNSNYKEQKEDTLKDKQDNIQGRNSVLSSEADLRSGSTLMTGGISLKKRDTSHIQEEADKNKTDQTINSTSTSPKRKKVLKTRIDERGREVTEVVWEGETADNDGTNANAPSNDTTNRPPLADKPKSAGSNAPSNPVNIGGNKKPPKGGHKDAKQGNLLSFFKRI